MCSSESEKEKDFKVYFLDIVDDEPICITDAILSDEKFNLIAKSVKKIIIEFFTEKFDKSYVDRLAIKEKLEAVKFELGNVDCDFWSASYCEETKTVSCKEGLNEIEVFTSLIHELIHVLSYHNFVAFPCENIVERHFSGLTVAECKRNDDGTEKRYKLNIGLNEAVTEYLSLHIRKYGLIQDCSHVSYFIGVFAMGILRECLGKDIIIKAYFFGETYLLKKELEALSGDDEIWVRLNRALTFRTAYAHCLSSVEDVDYAGACEKDIDKALDSLIGVDIRSDEKFSADIREIESDFLFDMIFGKSDSNKDRYKDNLKVREKIIKDFSDYIYSKEDAPSERSQKYDICIENYIKLKSYDKRWFGSGLPFSCIDRWIELHLCAFKALNFDQIIRSIHKYNNHSLFENRIRAISRELKKKRKSMLPFILDTFEREIINYDNEASFRHYERELIDDVKAKVALLRSELQSDK